MHSKSLLNDPGLDLLDRVLLPVKVVLHTLLLKLFEAQHIEELIVVDQADIVLVHEAVELLFDRHAQIDDILHASVELCKGDHSVIVEVKLVKGLTILHTLLCEAISDLLDYGLSLLFRQATCLWVHLSARVEGRLGHSLTTVFKEGHIGQVSNARLDISLRDETILINVKHV